MFFQVVSMFSNACLADSSLSGLLQNNIMESFDSSGGVARPWSIGHGPGDSF